MTSRIVSSVFVAAFVAAGCGGDGGGETVAETESATTVGSSTTSPADLASPESVDTQPSSITVETDFGVYEVPADPTRLVIMDPTVSLTTALDLGVSVFGTLMTDDLQPPVMSLVTEDEWAQLESVGVLGLANYEAMARAKPDLILAWPRSVEEFELYEAIAPSIPLVPTNDWRDDSRLVAASLGKAEEMEDLLAQYDERASALAQRIDEEIGDPTVAFVRIRPDMIRVHTSVHFAGNVLTDAGLRLPAQWMREIIEDDPVANLSQRVVEISPELVGDLASADYLIVLVKGVSRHSVDEVDAALEVVESSSLWQALPAVRNDQVHFVESHWLVGSMRAAYLGLADLEHFLFPE